MAERLGEARLTPTRLPGRNAPVWLVHPGKDVMTHHGRPTPASEPPGQVLLPSEGGCGRTPVPLGLHLQAAPRSAKPASPPEAQCHVCSVQDPPEGVESKVEMELTRSSCRLCCASREAGLCLVRWRSPRYRGAPGAQQALQLLNA